MRKPKKLLTRLLSKILRDSLYYSMKLVMVLNCFQFLQRPTDNSVLTAICIYVCYYSLCARQPCLFSSELYKIRKFGCDHMAKLSNNHNHVYHRTWVKNDLILHIQTCSLTRTFESPHSGSWLCYSRYPALKHAFKSVVYCVRVYCINMECA